MHTRARAALVRSGLLGEMALRCNGCTGNTHTHVTDSSVCVCGVKMIIHTLIMYSAWYDRRLLLRTRAARLRPREWGEPPLYWVRFACMLTHTHAVGWFGGARACLRRTHDQRDSIKTANTCVGVCYNLKSQTINSVCVDFVLTGDARCRCGSIHKFDAAAPDGRLTDASGWPEKLPHPAPGRQWTCLLNRTRVDVVVADCAFAQNQ